MAPRDLRVEIMHFPAPRNENNTPSGMPFPTAGDQRDAQQALGGDVTWHQAASGQGDQPGALGLSGLPRPAQCDLDARELLYIQ